MTKTRISGGIGGGYPLQLVGLSGLLGCTRILCEEETGNGAPAGTTTGAGASATQTAQPSGQQTQANTNGRNGNGAPAGGGTAAPTNQGGGTATQTAGVSDEFRPLLDAVAQRTQEAIGPINQRVTDLANQLNALSTQTQGAEPRRIFRSPQATSGGTWGRLESQGYRFARAYARTVRCQYLGDDATKLEHDVHQRLYKHYVEAGGMELGGVQSLLVPYGSSAIIDFEPGLGAELAQMVAAGVAGADPSEIRQMVGRHYMAQGMRGDMLHQTLSMFDESALGVFVSGGRDAELIELVRNREVFSRAGASQITLPPNGYLPMPRQTGATTGYWVGENAPITSSEPSTGQISMRARKSAALVTFPNELLRFATPSVEAFLRMDMARVLALLADLAFLEGSGTMTQPKGLLNYSGVVSYTAGTVATDGDTLEPEDPALMLAEIEERNHDLEVDEFTWCMRPKMWANIRNRRTSVYDGAGLAAEGKWLFETNRGDHTNGQQPILEGKRVLRSSQISNSRTKGASSDLTYILGGIFRHWIVGNHGVMEFATSVQGDTVFANDQTKLRAIRHVDGIPRYEDAFVVCDDIDMDLP